MQPIKYGTNSLIKEISAEKLTDALQKPTKVNVNISGANGKSSSSCKQILQQQISAKKKNLKLRKVFQQNVTNI